MDLNYFFSYGIVMFLSIFFVALVLVWIIGKLLIDWPRSIVGRRSGYTKKDLR